MDIEKLKLAIDLREYAEIQGFKAEKTGAAKPSTVSIYNIGRGRIILQKN